MLGLLPVILIKKGMSNIVTLVNLGNLMSKTLYIDREVGAGERGGWGQLENDSRKREKD